MSTYGSDLQLRGVRVERLIYHINNEFEDLDNIENVDNFYNSDSKKLVERIKVVDC